MLYFIQIILAAIFATSAFASGSIDYSVDGETYEGYYINPSPDSPLILLLHDWDGLTDYEVKRANMLAEMGFTVFAADLFGKGVRPTEVKDKREHTGELYKDRKKMRSLLFGALDAAKAQGGNISNAVAIGYCFGGSAVLELARAGADLKGFVTFHGGLTTPNGQSYSNTKGQVLIFHGSSDANITMGQFAELTRKLEEAKVPHEMITYGGTPHAFTVFGSGRYREDADRKSWQRFSEFLQETLK